MKALVEDLRWLVNLAVTETLWVCPASALWELGLIPLLPLRSSNMEKEGGTSEKEETPYGDAEN